ncbi:MAG: hypothetical protein JWP52_3397 [Rhizobacter sp.]|jgi:protein CpxP|nr:hypothetical protein [Rhizobacter sp.]
MVNRMLRSVNATDAQRTQVHQILQAAASDIKSYSPQGGRGDAAQAMAILTAPTVDANAAEVLRQQAMARQDQVSKRMLAAMIDVSRVLTPEQRAQLAQKMQQRHDAMQKHMQERNAARPAS